MRKLAKKIIPMSLRNMVREKRVEPVLKWIYRKELKDFIQTSPVLSEDAVSQTMQKHNLSHPWAGVYTLLSDIPSQEYVPEDFFHIHILPRMNNMDYMSAYEDKNLYDSLPFAKYAVRAILRKIEGRYFDGSYEPVSQDQIEKKFASLEGDIVIKPAIDSGSGKGVWIGDASEGYDEFMTRYDVADLIVQPCLKGSAFSQKINPNAFNTIRCMTAFTGKEYIVVASALRMAQGSARIDNQNTGGLVLAIREDGTLCKYGYDKYLNRFTEHPDTHFVFEGQKMPGYKEITAACLEAHKYLPHFGLVSWDVSIDSEDNVRIIELNLDWQGINLFQSALGPLFGSHKEQIRATYNIPEWKNWK